MRDFGKEINPWMVVSAIHHNLSGALVDKVEAAVRWPVWRSQESWRGVL